MQTKLKIRKFQAGDLHRVAELFDAYRQFYEQRSDPKLAVQFISARMENNESVILVAESAAGRLEGFCQLYPTFCSVLAQPVFVLYDLFVAPAARGHGAARRLLDAAVALAGETGRARLDLTTAKNNLNAQSLYESQGWERDHEFFSYSYNLPKRD